MLSDKDIYDILLRVDSFDYELAEKYSANIETIKKVRIAKTGRALRVLLSFDKFERDLFEWRMRREKYAKRKGLLLSEKDRQFLREEFEAANPRPF